MKFRRLVAAAAGCAALTVAAPATASALTWSDLLPPEIAQLIPSGSAVPFAPPAAPAPPVDPPVHVPAPESTPAPQVQQQSAPSRPAPAPSRMYKNCTEVWNDLGRPIRSHEAGFGNHLDRDRDGVGCESRPR